MKVACPVWEGLQPDRSTQVEYGGLILLHDEMIKNIENSFSKATEFRERGELQESIKMLLIIAADYSSPAIYGTLGAVYREAGDMYNAVKFFQKTVMLSPDQN